MFTGLVGDIALLAREAGQLIAEAYSKTFDVRHKGMIDLVTDTDHASEAHIIRSLESKYPTASILAEETGSHERDGELRFIVDPLDGTVNFAHKIPYFCVLIAAQKRSPEGKFETIASVTYDPMGDDLFVAKQNEGATLNGERIQVSTTDSLLNSLLVTGFGYERLFRQPDNHAEFCRLNLLSQGVRRFGSAGLDLAYVASGRFDGYWEYGLHPWDKAAGLLLIQEAGGITTDRLGNPAHYDSASVVASGDRLHKQLLEALFSASTQPVNTRDGLEAFLPKEVADKLIHARKLDSF